MHTRPPAGETLTAERAVFDGRINKASNYVGNYTLAISPVGDGSVSPGGYGYAAVSVNAAGAVAMGGSLADGSAINQGATVNGDGQWPLFAAFPGAVG